jgi:hypothetical protein
MQLTVPPDVLGDTGESTPMNNREPLRAPPPSLDYRSRPPRRSQHPHGLPLLKVCAFGSGEGVAQPLAVVTPDRTFRPAFASGVPIGWTHTKAVAGLNDHSHPRSPLAPQEQHLWAGHSGFREGERYVTSPERAQGGTGASLAQALVTGCRRPTSGRPLHGDEYS